MRASGPTRVVIPLACWRGVWQLAVIFVGKELLLPGPGATVLRLFELAGTAQFWQTVAFSLLRIFGGFLGGAVLGVVLAGLTSASRWLDLLLSPVIRVMRAIPVASFILLLQLWLWKGRVPGVCAGLMVLPVVWQNVSRGFRETDPLLLEAARAYRFGRWKKARLIYVPSAMPYFASACATGLGLAWKAGVAAEVLCRPDFAIGEEIFSSKFYYETPTLFAWTVVVILLSFVLENLLGRVFRGMERGRRA